jgi:8-oxo-dGTP diphosphatase
MEEIRVVDPEKAASSSSAVVADCVVLTHEGKLYMQHRTWGRWVGHVNTFGGHVEAGETSAQAVMRELNEETGAKIKEKDLVFIGAITEDWTNHTEVVHLYFWHDKERTITGCYECESITFDSVKEALAHAQIMPYAKWALEECKGRGLFKNP